MRNSLALLGIPDLPIYAFRHVGDRRIQPQGGGGGIPIVSDIVDAGGDLVSSVSDAAADLDDTVNEEIPGGWATVVSVAVPAAAPYVQTASVLDKGGSLEDAAKAYAISQVASQVGGEVAGETGSTLVGNVAGGTTRGLLSGQPLEQSVTGSLTNAAISQVTPSSLFTPSTSATTGANNMADYFDYPQFDTGESVSGYYGNPTDFNSGESVSGYYGNAADFGGGESVSGFYGGQDLQNSLDSIYNPNLLQQLTPAIRSRLQSALAAGGSAAQAARNYLSSMGGGMNSNLLQGGAGTVAQLMQLQANREAAQQAQARIGQATQQAVAGAQFRPVGTTTRFGTSQFQVDPATGQLTSAGYTAAPEITSAQNRLMSLGSSYLAQTPEEVAQQYMTRQYDLLDPSRQRQLAGIRNENFRTGRGGLSVGSTGLRPSGAQGLMGANPELEAYYNALAQQDAQLAAQAQEAGQRQVSFGTGLFGQAGQLETMAQQPFSLSQGLAEKSSLGGARAGSLGIQGNVYGNAIGLSGAMTNNPYATVLGGLSSPTSLLAQGLGTYFGSSAPIGGTPADYPSYIY
jgi:hypothetical protein